MADVLTFVSRSGSVIFDFEQKKIIFDRGGVLSDTMGLISMEINMEEVTDIELRQPTMMKLGAFNIIVNNVRYVTQTGLDATQFALTKKAEFPAMQMALQRVLAIAGRYGFKAENEVNVARIVYTGPQDNDVVFSFTNNTNSSLRVYSDYLVIKHAGALNFMSKSGLKGEKRINFSSISSIECRNANTMSAGFLQFSIMGSGVGGGLNAAAGDENSILFDATKNNLVQQIVEYIERRRIELAQPQFQQVVQNVSAADEIEKFKNLLDKGIITQEEFDAKKKQLLAL